MSLPVRALTVTAIYLIDQDEAVAQQDLFAESRKKSVSDSSIWNEPWTPSGTSTAGHITGRPPPRDGPGAARPPPGAHIIQNRGTYRGTWR